MELMTRILVPVDVADLPPPTVEYAARLARKVGAEVVLLNVVPELPIPDAYAIVDTRGVMRKDAVERLTHWQNEIPDVNSNIVVEFGEPGQEIVKYAEAHDIDLIVMATHGRRGLGRFILGSTTERVVRRAPCPVLSLRLAPVRV